MLKKQIRPEYQAEIIFDQDSVIRLQNLETTLINVEIRNTSEDYYLPKNTII